MVRSHSLLGASAELFDPVAGTCTTTNPLNFPCASHTATLLWSGMVLLTGGNSSTVQSTAELF